jgi:hypothetical protein
MAGRRRGAAAPAAPAEPVPAAGTAEPPPPPALGFDKWIGFLSTFVAPATLITALLFYFGYVSSRTFFLYFGVDVDMLGLSTQQFVMRSPGALFIPVTVLLILASVLILVHHLLRRRLLRSSEASRRRAVRAFAWAGGILLAIGLVLAFSYALIGTWDLYALATSVCLATGAGLGAYAVSTSRAVAGGTQGRAVVVLLVAVMVAGTFWATATVAEFWGRGQARVLAADLSTLPAVVLDTKERIFPGNDAITVTSLAPDTKENAGEYLYRYFGLRLLVRGGDYLFLVPDHWSKDASTLVMPIGDEIRVRFRFFPDANPPD